MVTDDAQKDRMRLPDGRVLIMWLRCKVCGLLFENSGRQWPRPIVCTRCRG
jgi:hypothetical protein